MRGTLIKCQDKCFSKGTDYWGLAHTYSKGLDSSHQYLTQLYQFLYSVGKLESPIVALMDGKCYGSAACFALLSHFPTTTPNTNVCFPETGFGFVPTGGASYFLSRMPDHIGLYLALTGTRLLGADLCHLGLAENHMESNVSQDDQFAASINSMPERLGTRRMFGDQWLLHREAKIMGPYVEMVGDLLEIKNRINGGDPKEHWLKQRENTRMVIADVLYRRKLEEQANEDGVRQYRGFKGQTIVNHLVNFEAQCVSTMQHTVKSNFSLEKYRGAILRCFSAPTLDELFSRLREESVHGLKDWADFTLQQIQSRSPLATAVTFKLVTEAAQLQWYECLQREFSAAANLASHPDFHEGVRKRLGGNVQPEWTVKYPVQPSLIARVCKPRPLSLGAKHNELLPTRDYFRRVPSSPRLWLNELSTNIPYLREDHEFDVKTFLNGMDVDLRTADITPGLVRRLLFTYYTVEKGIEKEVKRIQGSSSDPISVKMFVRQREAAIQKFFSAPEAQTCILELLKQGFRASFSERLDTVTSKSEDAQRLTKNSFLKELKEFLVEKRFIRSQDQQVADNMKMILETKLALPMKFPKDNNKSFLQELTGKLRDPAPLLDFYSILDYKNYFYSGASPYEQSREITDALNEMLSDIGRHLTDTINFSYSHLNPDHSETTDTLLTQRVSLDTLLKAAQPVEEGEEKEDVRVYEDQMQFLPELEVEETKPEPPPEPEPEPARLPELLAELYVKFGEVSPVEAAERLAQGLPLDLAGMKARRREILKMQFHTDTRVLHPNSKAFKMKQLFTELYVEPDDAEVDDVLAGKLELESAREFVDTARAMRSLRRERKRPVENYESEEEDRDLKFTGPVLTPDKPDLVLTDLPHSVQLDTMYLQATMGDRAFMPSTLANGLKEPPEELVTLGNFTELPQEWLQRNLLRLSKILLQYRANIEMTLTRAELVSFDQRFLHAFTAELFNEALLQQLYHEEAFLTSTGAKARLAVIATEHEAMQPFKAPVFKSLSREDEAESQAIKHALDMKMEREYLKPKTPLQFSAMDELDFSNTTHKGPAPAVTPLNVQQEYAEHKAFKAKLKAKEASLLETQKTVAALKLLVQQQKYRKRLSNPAAVEAILKKRERTLV